MFVRMAEKYFHKLKVSDITRLTPESVQLTFDLSPDLKSSFQYKAGQYLTIKKTIAGEELRRSYSICTSPEEDKLSVGIKKVEGGRFSSFANDHLAVGDELEIMEPMGNFTLPIKPNHRLVCFAAGSGITPILAHIKQLLTSTPTAEVILFYGNKNTESLMFKDEIEALKNKFMTRFSVFHIFSKEMKGASLLSGRLSEDKCNKFSKIFFKPTAIDDFLICGPNEMIFELKDTLLSLNVPQEKIHFELFNTSDLVKNAPVRVFSDGSSEASDCKVTIKLDGDSFDFNLNYGGNSLLDAALSNGADLPYACKGGVCSTCKAKLMEGKVTMDRNYALEPDELAAGYILTCQSHPDSSIVVVDFDQK